MLCRWPGDGIPRIHMQDSAFIFALWSTLVDTVPSCLSACGDRGRGRRRLDVSAEKCDRRLADAVGRRVKRPAMMDVSLRCRHATPHMRCRKALSQSMSPNDRYSQIAAPRRLSGDTLNSAVRYVLSRHLDHLSPGSFVRMRAGDFAADTCHPHGGTQVLPSWSKQARRIRRAARSSYDEEDARMRRYCSRLLLGFRCDMAVQCIDRLPTRKKLVSSCRQ